MASTSTATSCDGTRLAEQFHVARQQRLADALTDALTRHQDVTLAELGALAEREGLSTLTLHQLLTAIQVPG